MFITVSPLLNQITPERGAQCAIIGDFYYLCIIYNRNTLY